MTRLVRIVMSAALAMALAAPAVVAQDDPEPAPPADAEVVQVINVIDGDTIRVERENGDIERVRYIGIDTPEFQDENKEPEPYSRQAALANAGFVENQTVLLETGMTDRDGLDRLLRYVWVETENGWVMVNERMVALGLADVQTSELGTRYQEYFEDSLASAKLTGRGKHDESAIARQLIGAEAMAYLFFDAYDARDVPTLRRLMTAEVVYRLPGNERYRGKKEVMNKFREEWAELDPVVTIRNSIAQPESAVLEVTIVTNDHTSTAETDVATSPAPIESPEPAESAEAIESAAPIGSPEPGSSGDPVDGLDPIEVIETPAPIVGLEAVAVQQWPRDKLADFRLYYDE